MPNPNPPLLSNALLAELAAAGAADPAGEADAPRRAMLAMALPEMAAELLRHRAAARATRTARQIARARRILRGPDPIPSAILAAACRVLLAHSSDPGELTCAREVLAQITQAA